MREYDPGQQIELRFRFWVRGELTDPTGIALTILKPDRSTDSFVIGQLTKEAVGVYSKEITLDELPGAWHYKAKGSGVNATAVGDFRVRNLEIDA